MTTAQRITRWLCLPLLALFLATSTLDMTLIRPHAALHWIAQTALAPLMLMTVVILPAMRRATEDGTPTPVLQPRWGMAIVATLCIMLAVELAVGATDVRHFLLLGLSLGLIAAAAVGVARYTRWKADTRYIPRIR